MSTENGKQGDRYILYVRQSHEQSGRDEPSLSIAFQERTLREMVTRNGGAVIEPPIVDPDEKGWDPNRPGIADLIARVERERPDAIGVYAVSRFARDNWLQESIWRQVKKINPDLRFDSATEPHAEDDMVRGILGVISQAERKRMGTFLSSAFRERARRGIPHGKVPYGFRKGDDGRLLVNEDARPWVLAMVDHLEAGWSLWRVSVWLNEQQVDGRTWEPTVVGNTVRTPAIAGCVHCADVFTWGAHEAIIPRERWERLVALLATRRAIRTKQTSSWLEGRIACGCGANMHLIYNKPHGRSLQPQIQFRCAADPAREQFQRPRTQPACTFRPRSILRGKAERLAIAELTNALATIATPEEVYAKRITTFANHERSNVQERRRLEKAITQTLTEQERLLTLYRRGSLDVDRWEREDADVTARLATHREKLATLPTPPDLRHITRSHDTITGIWSGFANVIAASPEQGRRLLLELDARFRVTADGLTLILPEDFAAFVT